MNFLGGVLRHGLSDFWVLSFLPSSACPPLGFFLISPGFKKTVTDIWVPLGPVEDLIEGEPTLFQFTRTERIGWDASGISYGVYVFHKGGGEYDVFSNVCTHPSCRYRWREDLNHFFCPCHDGHYAKDGTVLEARPETGSPAWADSGRKP